MPFRISAALAAPLGALLAMLVSATAALAALKPGDAAPNFAVLAAQGGKMFPFKLADALKKGPVVLYFYPKSFTSTCTLEAHQFADNIGTFEAAGASVLGVSADRINTQREFSSKECRDTFPVGADPNLDVIKAYDAAFSLPVMGATFAKRISYVIAPDGHILEAHSDMSAEPHIERALAAVRAWRAAQH